MATKRTAAEKRRAAYDNELDSFLAQESAAFQETRRQRQQEEEERIGRGTATAGSPSTRVRPRRALDVAATPTPEEEEEQGLFGSLIDRIQSGAQRSLSGAAVTAGESSNPFVSAVAALPGTLRRVTDPSTGIDELARRALPAEAAIDDSAALYEAAKANEEAGRPAYDKFMSNSGWLTRQATEAVFDVAGSPSSALSVFGGPLGAAGAADVYAQTYAEARRAGLSPDEAQQRATAQAVPEGAVSVIPAGRFIPGLNTLTRRATSAVARPIVRAATRVGTSAVGEAVEEGVTEAAQIEADRVLSQIGSTAALREYADKQTPATLTEYFDRVARAAKAGAVGGAGLSTPHATMQEFADAGRRASALDQLASEADTRTTERLNRPAPEEPDLAPIIEARQRIVDETEAGFRTMEMRRQAEAMAASNPMAAAMLQSGALEVTPEQVRAEREQGTADAQRQAVADEEAAKPVWQRTLEAVERERGTAAPVTGVGIQEPNADIRVRGRRRRAASIEAPTSGGLTADDIRAFASGTTLPQTTDRPAGSTTAGQAIRAVREKLGPKNVNVLGKLMTDGNLRVVDDVSEVPGDAVENGAGFYDGQNMYVIANRLDPDNLVGDMLNIAAHEGKHAADIGGEALRPTIGEFIGGSANEAINRKIEAAADSGNPVAVAARNAARANSNAQTYSLELPAYFINAQRLSNENKGPMARIASNIVSAVRTGYKRLKGGDIDVNLDDVSYLADRLLEEAAISGQPLTGRTDQPLAMIMGENAPGFGQAQLEGRTFTDIDGREKFVTSDADSSIRLTPAIERTLETPNGSIQAKFLLQHPDLFRSYPELGNAEVFVLNSLKGLSAGYSEAANTVTISRELWDRMRSSDSGRDIGRGLILHELQHGIQGLENFARGGNPDQFLTKEQVKEAKRFADATLGLTRYLDRLISGADVPRQIRDTVRFTAQNVKDGNLSLREGYLDILDDFNSLKEVPYKLRPIVYDISELVDTATTLGPAVTKAQAETQDKYMRLRGEQEAYFVQDARNTRQEDLPVNPTSSYEGEPIVSFREGALSEGQAPLAVNMDDLRRGLSKAKKPSNFVYRSLIDFTGGLGRELNEMREFADSQASKYSHRAMNTYANIEQQIKNMAVRGVEEGKYKSIKEGQQAIRQDLEKKLDAIAKLPTPQRRESALAALVRENPYYTPVAKAYSEITQLTRTLVGQLIQNNPNPTPEELKLMSTMVNNTFGYSTRMYAAFQGKEGQRHSRKLIEEHDAVSEALAKGKTVPDKYKESFRVFRNAMDYLIKNDLNIPQDEDGMYELDSEQLSNLYDTWIGDAKRAKAVAIADGKNQGMSDSEAREYASETMISALQQRAAPTQGEYEGKARDIINGMLGLEQSTGPIANYYRGFRQDRSILERRERVPDEIKELFGEINDPATRLAVTIAKQGELAARTRLLLDMRDKGTGKWVIPQQDAGLPGNENFTASLDGETYGPLAGYRTTPEIANAIGENLEMFTSLGDAVAKSYLNATKAGETLLGKGIQGIQTAAGWQKLASIVFEPFGILMNGMGSPVMLMANGVTDPRVIRDAIRTGGQSVMDTAFGGRGELSPELEDAIQYGLLDSARVQEIRRTPQKFVKKLVTTKPATVSAAGGAISTGARTAIETFAISDAWVKVAAFKDRVNDLTKYYNAEGISKTEEEIKREAANTIKDTNITYGRTAPGVRLLESTGWTSFLPYFVSVPRSLAYNTITAYKDFIRAKDAKTTEGKLALGLPAVKRLAGTGAATYGIVVAMKALASALNSDDEEEAKKVMRPDARFSDSIYLGKDSKGNPLFFRLSRVDPYGPANDMLRILLDDSITTEQAIEYTGDQLKDLLFTNRLTSSVASLGANLITDDDIKDNETRLERIAPAATQKAKDMMLALGADYSSANSFLKVLDTMTPGWLDSIDPSNPKVQDAKDGPYEALGNFVRWSGGRLDRADPKSYAYQLGQELSTEKKDGRKRMNDSLKAGYDPDQIADILNNTDNEVYEKLSRFQQVYEGMTKGLKYSQRQAQEVLKESGKLTGNEVNAIKRGRIQPGMEEEDLKELGLTLSKASLEQHGKNAERKLTKEEIKEDKKRREELLKKLKALGYKVGE